MKFININLLYTRSAAADFLVNLGDIGYYPETRAADWVVLDSQWLTNAFATVISLRGTFIKGNNPPLTAGKGGIDSFS